MKTSKLLSFIIPVAAALVMSACEYSGRYSETNGSIVSVTTVNANRWEAYIHGSGQVNIEGHSVEVKGADVLLDGAKIASDVRGEKVEIKYAGSFMTVQVGKERFTHQY